MLSNLKAEMARHNVEPKDLAVLLNVRVATIYDKLNGHYDFKLNEALKIKRTFFPTYEVEYLFDKKEEEMVK